MKYHAWTREAVWLRFLEAADTMRRLPPIRGPQEFGSNWPEVLRDFADKTGSEETRDKKSFEESWYRRTPPSPDAITRMFQTVEWVNLFLADYAGQRRCFWALIGCRARRRSFSRKCREKGWALSTATRKAGQALDRITGGLNDMAVPVYHAGEFDAAVEWRPPPVFEQLKQSA